MSDLTNTKLLHEMLRDAGFSFTAPPDNQPPPAIGDLTSLSFEDNTGDSWIFYIFSTRDQASLRFYSSIATPINPFTPLPTLDLINKLNAAYFFKSSLDYIDNPLSVRYKAAFDYPLKGLPAYEAMSAIRHHIVCSSYLHHLLKFGYKQPYPFSPIILGTLIADTNKLMGYSQAPAFL
ncbi:hypothetical protein AB4851_22575 [Burkholderia sp. 22PA0099]|uniref:hypothetical protein n=1 Tax=Burkholderia sp. 22PA0099 TaxID=3237372 RepID=UPI0039C41294